MWPCNFFQKNSVRWLREKDGVSFKRYGIIYSRESIKQNILKEKQITVEIVIQPGEEPGNGIKRIVSFYNPEKRYEEFHIGQWRSHLIIRRKSINPIKNREYNEIGEGYALRKNNVIHLTISSGETGTSIYINGKQVKVKPDFKLIPRERIINGKIILGNSPASTDGWEGTIYALAIYNTTLPEKQVFNYYKKWKQNNTISKEANQVMLYQFDEASGSTVNNRLSSANHLFIPYRLNILKKDILSFSYRKGRLKRSDILDILLNILGFIPVGFFIALGISETRFNSRKQVYSITLLTCCGISILVEILQVYIPSRDSCLLDLFLNVMGACIGIFILYFAFLFNSPKS